MSYRQTIDAVNALHNEARIGRHGRKFTARWGSLELVQPDPADAAASWQRSLLTCRRPSGVGACGSALYWARKLQGMGRTVRLMAPQFVKLHCARHCKHR
jgi:transposase